MAEQTTVPIGNRLEETTSRQAGVAGDSSRQYIRRLCRIDQPMDRQGGLRLSTVGGQCFKVVDYATEQLREALARIEQGTAVEAHLVRLGSQANAWRVVSIEFN